MSKLTLATSGLALAFAASSAAYAQTDTMKPADPMKPAGTMATTAAPMTTAAGGFITQGQKGQWRASKLVGVDIYNNADENIGEVNELLVDGSGRVLAVIVGVGGFLGIGEKNVALPFETVKWSDTPRQVAANANPPAAGAGPATPAAPANPVVPDATGAIAAPTILDYPDHGMINMTKDQLQNAPEFKYVSEK